MSIAYKAAFFLSNKMGKGLPIAIKSVAALMVLGFAGAVVHLHYANQPTAAEVAAANAVKAKQAEPAKPMIVYELTEAEKAKNRANMERIEAQVAKEEKARKAEAKKQGVAIGYTEKQAIESSWGKPQSVSTTTTHLGTKSQWVYGNRHYLYFTNGVLTAIQN